MPDTYHTAGSGADRTNFHGDLDNLLPLEASRSVVVMDLASGYVGLRPYNTHVLEDVLDHGLAPMPKTRG